MNTIHGFSFVPLEFDADGALVRKTACDELRAHVADEKITDVVLIAHGFRNDEDDARNLYTEFLKTLRHNLQRPEFSSLGSRSFVVGGVFWPSKAFRESFGRAEGTVQNVDEDASDLAVVIGELAELSKDVRTEQDRAAINEALGLLPQLEGNPDKQDRFVELVLSTIHESESDPTEGLTEVKARSGSELLARLSTPVILPTSGASVEEGGVSTVGSSEVEPQFAPGGALGFGSFVGSLAGRVGQFLNLATWYQMKERSGNVGARGVATCVAELRAQSKDLRIHLVGHSLGGRLMAGCMKALTVRPEPVPVNSLTLLQAAFSHYGFSTQNNEGTAGFFRPVMDNLQVLGPMVATFSFQDEVVGRAYAIASRLAGDNTRAIGDRNDAFGGIGRNGAQNLDQMHADVLHSAGTTYQFVTGRLHCLDGSGGLITSHGDVRNERVTYAVASVLAAT